jgi:hypothetical protein
MTCGNFYPASPCPTTVVSVPPPTTASTGTNLSGIGTGLIVLLVLGVVALTLSRRNSNA